MLKKISALPIIVSLALASFAREIKRDERGLSGVVVAILLILVAVLAVVLIWGFLSGWLREMWATIVEKTPS